MSHQGCVQFRQSSKKLVLRLEFGKPIAVVSDELKIRRKLLYEWQAAYHELGAVALNRKRRRKPGGARESWREGERK
jgi:hypothetical protein